METLMVVALIAILVILFMPSIMKYFNNAKEDTFLVEAKEIYSAVKGQEIKDYLTKKEKDGLYCKTITGESAKTLDLTSAERFSYKILLKNGQVVYFQVDNGEYSTFIKNYLDGIDIKDITDVNINIIPVKDCSMPENIPGEEDDPSIYTPIFTGYNCDDSGDIEVTPSQYFTFNNNIQTNIIEYSN